MSKKILPLAVGLLIAAIIAGVFVWWQKPTLFSFLPGSNATSTVSVNLGNGVTVPTSGEGVAVLPIENTSAKAPALNRPIQIPASIPADAAIILRQKLEEAKASLTANPEQLIVWLQYGIYLKMAEDYEGARQAWEYVAAAAPSNYLAFNNLGLLYMGILKEYPKAETNFLKVVALRPDYIEGYRNLFTLYHYAYKGDEAAANIVAEGLKRNPGNADLISLQNELKKGSN